MLEKLAVVSQDRSANYDGVRECVQSTAEGINEALNNFPQLHKEVDEFIDLCEDLSAVVLKLGLTEPQGFGEAVAGVRLRSE